MEIKKGLTSSISKSHFLVLFLCPPFEDDDNDSVQHNHKIGREGTTVHPYQPGSAIFNVDITENVLLERFVRKKDTTQI